MTAAVDFTVTGRVHGVSFRMYAEDFAGLADSTVEYRRGVLAFVAEHTGRPLAELAGYEVV